ncbi:5-methylcytosine-specific restriction endonuclease system specificity protein McrC [Kriegella aquimaris]|uniref:5-methylcytosine-specific restriction enzyme subunit McrC n=1 Tax=Kriegella aquimaris TaxID=192904 RepID=A0A1G9LCU0_9FLAO|nr:5-methylcytosine-specific restriction endonuclease system specificity protein McrC [Kriegella aquimaris]SDL59778.1 5-methylcytosine-specific restriction enzyme subunit McrC [Kriegella aquimaris]
MHIPIENIYYLLCYAWNKLEEKERVNISVDDSMEIKDLFAKILINGTRILLKRGIDKSYVDRTQEIVGVKGKIQISASLKNNLLAKQNTICSFDDFSSNILLNQILISTISNLIRINGLNKGLKAQLIGLKRKFNGIDVIKITKSHFKQFRINRNNRFYHFLMNVCEIIYENTMPLENSDYYEFTDFTRDENKMNQLFEAFIRNFYKIEQKKFNIVKSEIINWQLESMMDSRYLPQMKTDITLINKHEKIIIDAKYYRETMSFNYDTEKIKSNNLYQLFSYLLNQEDNTERNNLAKGILLYPTIEKEYNLNFRYKRHNIEIKTLNLNNSWQSISRRLHQIIGYPS